MSGGDLVRAGDGVPMERPSAGVWSFDDEMAAPELVVQGRDGPDVVAPPARRGCRRSDSEARANPGLRPTPRVPQPITAGQAQAQRRRNVVPVRLAPGCGETWLFAAVSSVDAGL